MAEPFVETQRRQCCRVVTKHDHIISVDWGSSQFRISLFEINNETIVLTQQSDQGVLSFKNLHQTERRTKMLDFLDDKIQSLASDSRVIELPFDKVYISGMAASSIGIENLPYYNLPIDTFYPKTVKAQFISPKGHKIALFSGWKTDVDVMRGEETQILGTIHQLGIRDGLFILPGTHSKHVPINNGHIEAFKTFMTGEVFELLKTQSILSASFQNRTNENNVDSFESGCNVGYSEPLLHAIFKVRSLFLIDPVSPIDASSYLSGIVIGHELSAIRFEELSSLYLIGSQALNGLYSRAIKYLGPEHINIISIDSTQASCLGHKLYHQKSM